MRYTVDKLKKWKDISEQLAILELEDATVGKNDKDIELIKFYVQSFDRPVFRDRICMEGRANKMCIYLRSIENKADYSKWDKLPAFLELVYNFGFLRLNFRCSFAGLERENISLNVCFSSVES